MAASTLVAEYLDLARPQKVLGKADAERATQLSYVAWSVMYKQAKQLVLDAGESPVLYSYGSDATPIVATTTVHFKVGLSSHVRRAGQPEEYLVQRAFLKTYGADNKASVCCLFKPPLPLSEGKGAWPVFTAMADFFPLLRRVPFSGLSVSHYTFDRMLFSSLDRKARQRHQLYYERQSEGGQRTGAIALQELLDWVVSTPCACHDAHNALKWALHPFAMADKDTVSHLHSCIASLRNGYSILHGKLSAFIVNHLHFEDANLDTQELYIFWVALGVSSSTAEELSSMQLRWQDQRLCIATHMLEEESVLERVTSCFLAIWRFKAFTDSRWCTVGDSCRSLVASLALGMEELMKSLLVDPDVGQYYIQGFAKLDQACKTYAVAAALVGYVPDAVLADILEDDRVAPKAPVLAELLQSELQYLTNLPAYVYAFLAEICHYASGVELQADVLEAAHCAAAYVTDKTLKPAGEFPWKLAAGDISSNLDALAQLPRQQVQLLDDTTSKIRQLLDHGYPRHTLVAGVRLMGEVHWSTAVVEQGHASATLMKRAHPGYSSHIIAIRSHLHMLRVLFAKPPVPREQREAEAMLLRLESKAPQRQSGRSLFYAETVREAKARLPEGQKLTRADLQRLMQQHVEHWKMLSPQSQALYDRQALGRAERQRQLLVEEVGQAREKLESLGHRALSQEALAEAALMKVSNCRFTDVALGQIQSLLALPSYSKVAAADKLRDMLQPPQAPKGPVRRALEDIVVVSVPLAAERESTRHGWLAHLCNHRDEFRHSAFLFESDLGRKLAVAFLFASQRPHRAHFLVLQEVSSRSLPATPPVSENLAAAFAGVPEHQFSICEGQYVTDEQLDVQPHLEPWIVPYLAFR